MKSLKQHITEFSEMLAEKGFDGSFLTCLEFPAKLQDSLTEYVNTFPKLELEKNPITLSTYSDWVDDNSDYTFCFFKADYSKTEGFRIKELEIERTNIYGNVGSRKILTINDVKDIPTRKMANEMVNPPLLEAARNRRKGLKH